MMSSWTYKSYFYVHDVIYELEYVEFKFSVSSILFYISSAVRMRLADV